MPEQDGPEKGLPPFRELAWPMVATAFIAVLGKYFATNATSQTELYVELGSLVLMELIVVGLMAYRLRRR